MSTAPLFQVSGNGGISIRASRCQSSLLSLYRNSRSLSIRLTLSGGAIWSYSRLFCISLLSSASPSPSSPARMNSAAGKRFSNSDSAPTHITGSSISSSDGRAQGIELPSVKRKLISSAPILKHLGLLPKQNGIKPTPLSKTKPEPSTSLSTTTLRQPKLPIASLSNIDGNERASSSPTLDPSVKCKPICKDEAALIKQLAIVSTDKHTGQVYCERSPSSSQDPSSKHEQVPKDEVSLLNQTSEVDSDKYTYEVHCERSPAVVESYGSIEDHLWQMENGISYQYDFSLPTSFGMRTPLPLLKRLKSDSGSSRCYSVSRGKSKSDYYSPGGKFNNPFESFDICDGNNDNYIRERISTHQFCADRYHQVLKQGMVLLKGYLTLDEQVSIVKECRELGLGPGGFYRPEFKNGAKLRLQMMCLGLDWDPQTRKYSERRQVDGARPPGIPHEFDSLVQRAMRDSQNIVAREYATDDVEDILPTMSADICIINFYNTTGRLGLHQDRDESQKSLTRELPVVSFSVGDSAEFLYGLGRQVEKAEKVILKSGDVLIFGGESRLIFHGVQSIIPGSAPRALIEETGLRPGRLNLTFRQY